MKSKDLQPRLRYPARLSFKIEEVKSFPDKKKLKEFVTIKPALQQMLKGLALRTKIKNYIYIYIYIYISIITLNVNGFNDLCYLSLS